MGCYIRTFGGLGSETGHFNPPHGIWMDARGPDPVLTAADRRVYRIQTFQLDGKHIGFKAVLRYPCRLHVHGPVMVVPELGARVGIPDAKYDHRPFRPKGWITSGSCA